MVGLLDDLANIHLEDNVQALGGRKQAANAVQHARDELHHPAKDSKEVIDISSDEDDGDDASLKRLPKARQLSRLTEKTSRASDNLSLSKLVTEFVDVLETTCSRSLTIEGFSFLDALYKQLADPSVFVQPIRTSKRSGGKENTNEDSREAEDAVAKRKAKLGKLLIMKGEVLKAQSNKTLAKLVKEFGAEIDKSKGKTLTKNAMEFLHLLGERLQDIK